MRIVIFNGDGFRSLITEIHRKQNAEVQITLESANKKTPRKAFYLKYIFNDSASKS